MIIGITGGTGCGKTTALSLIAELGGLVIDCDRVYHDLLKTDKTLLTAIEERFPGSVENGCLNRKKLAGIVFSDERALLDLNGITHKAVKKEVERLLETAPSLVAIDAIGLFEGELAALCDTTLAITAPEEVRISRLMDRDGITESQAAARINAQKNQKWFVEKCDYHLQNDGTMEAFRCKCIALYEKLGIIEK
jgi:dephospho-CoA kinase